MELSKRVFVVRDDKLEVNFREGGSVRPDLNSRSREDARWRNNSALAATDRPHKPLPKSGLWRKASDTTMSAGSSISSFAKCSDKDCVKVKLDSKREIMLQSSWVLAWFTDRIKSSKDVSGSEKEAT